MVIIEQPQLNTNVVFSNFLKKFCPNSLMLIKGRLTLILKRLNTKANKPTNKQKQY